MPSNTDANMKGLHAFIKSNDPVMMEAAKELTDIVAASSFTSPDYRTQMMSYVTIEPPGLESAKDNLAEFCKNTNTSDDPFAPKAIKCFVDRIVAGGFDIDFDMLTSIGIILGNSTYKEDGVRCLKRAGALISKKK